MIVHADDIGLTQSNVEGFADLVDFGLVTSGSVMMPTAWAPLAAAYAREHPHADVGVHMTLTSEWEGNRWSPLSTVDPSSGLIDPDGYMWQHGEVFIPAHKRGSRAERDGNPGATGNRHGDRPHPLRFAPIRSPADLPDRLHAACAWLIMCRPSSSDATKPVSNRSAASIPA